jgi:hypothetical protein
MILEGYSHIVIVARKIYSIKSSTRGVYHLGDLQTEQVL